VGAALDRSSGDAGVGGGLVFALGGACISLGSFTIDEKLFKSAEQGQPPPAAFVRDARRHFGWKN